MTPNVVHGSRARSDMRARIPPGLRIIILLLALVGATASLFNAARRTGPPSPDPRKSGEFERAAHEELPLAAADVSSEARPAARRLERRFTAPEGFEVQEVAPVELLSGAGAASVVNMAFDAAGNPALAMENGWILTLKDDDGDGVYDTRVVFSAQINTALGMCFVGPGDLLVNSEGPDGMALYRLRDADHNGNAEKIIKIQGAKGVFGEHGPHGIRFGYDGDIYIEYGNQSRPEFPSDPRSPARGLREDQFLPRILDPTGHSNEIRAPGGTIQRLDTATNTWSEFAGGLRNAFDFDINDMGDLFTFDSDMEQDVGLPWYRPIRVAHVVAGGDYGWRSGSGKFPATHIDTLPPVAEMGRGSPVGVEFYDHDVYPEKYRGALFLGDWARGRIRVLFPERRGASYGGASEDFITGEPLNVTDLAVGPDGSLYFSTGGRTTTGGLFRVRYIGKREAANPPADMLTAALRQPIHRSAWGRVALAAAKTRMGASWGPKLREVLLDTSGGRSTLERVRALEHLQVLGPPPDAGLLIRLIVDDTPEVRACAALLLGKHPWAEAAPPLMKALGDPDPLVQRRACESLVRAGLEAPGVVSAGSEIPAKLISIMDGPDRFARHAARLALTRVDRALWAPAILKMNPSDHPRAAFEGALALIHTQKTPADADQIFERLAAFQSTPMDDDLTIQYARLCQLAFLRDAGDADSRAPFKESLGAWALERHPAQSAGATRELELLLAGCEPAGALDELLARLGPDLPQEDQIHAAYALRTMKKDWTRERRDTFIAWFDRAREMAGGASFPGYIDHIWNDALALLPTDEERQIAETRKANQLAERARRIEALIAEGESVAGEVSPGPVLAEPSRMSFQELSDFLELDPMGRMAGDPERGRRVFHRAKCANCHVFGREGRGGGPDLSSVVKRFRRREILEAIMLPSKVISDQYQAVNIETTDDVFTGFVAGESEDALTLILPTGERQEIKKSEIKDRRPSQVSIMPEGLLGAMSLDDLVGLILFLERGAEPREG